ncbi:Pumilio homolog 6 [Durusdinium trenchii]|uniref:Chloroplastic (APUM-6) (AtPUM6) n=1 Tax=Durusdinium trenchii TaxID=1381693 RepID=A0ABP0RWM9_9DINO
MIPLNNPSRLHLFGSKERQRRDCLDGVDRHFAGGYNYAKKRTCKSITTSLSTLEAASGRRGAAIMNNTFCLAIFLALAEANSCIGSFRSDPPWPIRSAAALMHMQRTLSALMRRAHDEVLPESGAAPSWPVVDAADGAWEFSAETTAILLIQARSGRLPVLIALSAVFRRVHRLLDGFLILSLYPLCLATVYAGAWAADELGCRHRSTSVCDEGVPSCWAEPREARCSFICPSDPKGERLGWWAGGNEDAKGYVTAQILPLPVHTSATWMPAVPASASATITARVDADVHRSPPRTTRALERAKRVVEERSGSSGDPSIDELREGLRGDQAQGMQRLRGQVWHLSRDAAGCRIVQEALEVGGREAVDLARELEGHVLEAVMCPHANYVVQKVVSHLFVAASSFVVRELQGNAERVAKNGFACRIFCRLLEFSGTDATSRLVDELLEGENLCTHGFAHHVIQSILEYGEEHHKNLIAKMLMSELWTHATHKSSSYLIETALCYCSEEDQDVLVAELGHPEALLRLAMNPFGSFVARSLLQNPKVDAQVALGYLQDHRASVEATAHGLRFLVDVGLEQGEVVRGASSSSALGFGVLLLTWLFFSSRGDAPGRRLGRAVDVRQNEASGVADDVTRRLVLLLALVQVALAAKFYAVQNASASPEGCEAVQAELTSTLMKAHCGKLVQNFVNRGPDTKGCLAVDTPKVRLALANKMFKQCGAWHLYDFHQPSKTCWRWRKKGKCFERSTKCIGHKEEAWAQERKNNLCEVDCIPAQPTLTEKVMKSYCFDWETSDADVTPYAKGCKSEDSYYVRRALANKMFSHCGAHYLYDFDSPSSRCFEWIQDQKCWTRGTACGSHVEQRKSVARKALMCEIPKISIDGKTCKGTPYTFDKKKRCDGWKGLTEAQCLAKCRSNAKASRCPQKVCRAAVFYPSSGWCHLYDQCDELKEFASARFLGDEVPMRSIEGKRCKLTPYTSLGGGVCLKVERPGAW